jgi:hypothetical protein
MQHIKHKQDNVKSKVLLEWEASKPSLLLKLEATATTSSSLMEELLMTAATWEAEWLSLEGIALLLRLVIRVVTSIESGLELWVGKNFVCLVDLGHLLLCFVRTDALLSSLVRVVLNSELAVSLLNDSFVRVPVDTKNLVVVFLL